MRLIRPTSLNSEKNRPLPPSSSEQVGAELHDRLFDAARSLGGHFREMFVRGEQQHEPARRHGAECHHLLCVVERHVLFLVIRSFDRGFVQRRDGDVFRIRDAVLDVDVLAVRLKDRRRFRLSVVGLHHHVQVAPDELMRGVRRVRRERLQKLERFHGRRAETVQPDIVDVVVNHG